MTWYWAEGKNVWGEWEELTLNYTYEHELLAELREIKKKYRGTGKYSRYRIRHMEL